MRQWKLPRRVALPEEIRRRPRWAFSFQVSQLTEDFEAFFDVVAGQRLQTLGAEPLDRERSHDAAVKQGPLDDFAIQLLLRSNVSHETALQRAAGAGGVFYFLDRQCWGAKGMMPDSV